MVIQARQTVAGRLHDMEKQKSIILGVFGQIMKTINIHRRSVDQDICSSTVLVQYIIMLFFSHIVPYLDKEFGDIAVLIIFWLLLTRLTGWKQFIKSSQVKSSLLKCCFITQLYNALYLMSL